MYPNLRCLTCFLKINDNFLKKEEILEFFTFQFKNLHFRKILELKIFFFKIIFRGALYMVFRYQSMFHPAPYKLIYIFFFLPSYSGKQTVKGTCWIFDRKISVLFKKRTKEVFANHLLLQIESNNTILSCIRF